MKTILLFILPLFVLSCTEQKQKNTPATEPLLPARDSSQVRTFPPDRFIYTEKAKLDLKDFFVSVQSGYKVDSTYDEKYSSLEDSDNSSFEGNYLFVRRKKDNHTDTLKLESNDQELTDLKIEDLTDSLHFKRLFLNLSWRELSDAPFNELVGYEGDSLRTFVSLYSLLTLRRKDKFTLKGFVGGRDEVVENFEYDYPITISLKNYSVSDKMPATQYIGFNSIALEKIKGYRMLSPNDSIPYTIDEDTGVKVDTFYRSKGIVRVVIADSIIVHLKLETAKEKLHHNAAG